MPRKKHNQAKSVNTTIVGDSRHVTQQREQTRWFYWDNKTLKLLSDTHLLPKEPISFLFFLLNPRQILIPDTSPCLFHKFLGYVYSGMVDMRSLSMDEVPEMLALSDKYEVWAVNLSYTSGNKTRDKKSLRTGAGAQEILLKLSSVHFFSRVKTF